MSGFVLTEEARSDLMDILSFVGAVSVPAARQLQASILKKCALLALQPGIGHRRSDLCRVPNLRFYKVSTWYLIVYDIDTQPLRVIRIVHGARDVKRELAG